MASSTTNTNSALTPIRLSSKARASSLFSSSSAFAMFPRPTNCSKFIKKTQGWLDLHTSSSRRHSFHSTSSQCFRKRWRTTIMQWRRVRKFCEGSSQSWTFQRTRCCWKIFSWIWKTKRQTMRRSGNFRRMRRCKWQMARVRRKTGRWRMMLSSESIKNHINTKNCLNLLNFCLIHLIILRKFCDTFRKNSQL